MANQLFYDVILWFNSNLLTLNYEKKLVALIILIIALQFDVSTSCNEKRLHSGHVVVCTGCCGYIAAMLLFVPPYCRCHDDGSFRFTVIGCGLRLGLLAVTSRFLWLVPYLNEILDVDTSKHTMLNTKQITIIKQGQI